MASKKRKILCKKCTEVKNRSRRSNGKERQAPRESDSQVYWSEETGERKPRNGKWRSVSLHRQPTHKLNVEIGKRNRTRGGSPSSYLSAYDGDECMCDPLQGRGPGSEKASKATGILKRRMSSADVVANYMNSGMGQVASFIVESALRFGKEHGVVVPETKNSDIYQIASPRMFDDRKRTKKIRFKIPEGTLGYEDAKKAMWRRGGKGRISRELDRFVKLESVKSRHPMSFQKDTLGSPSESIKGIMPILERLKDGSNVVDSDLDMRKVSQYIKEEARKAKMKKRCPARKRRMKVECDDEDEDEEEEEEEEEDDDDDDVRSFSDSCTECEMDISEKVRVPGFDSLEALRGKGSAGHSKPRQIYDGPVYRRPM